MSFRLSAVCLFVLVAISFAHATSVVATLGLKRIILAADTREAVLESGLSKDNYRYRDVRCKLAPLGRTAVAVAGNVKYIRNDPNDSVPDWDALRDAKAAYAVHGLDLHEMAADWARRSELQYIRFYAVAPLRVRQLASVNAETYSLTPLWSLVWQGRVPILYWEKVFLDESLPTPIQSSIQLLPYRQLPYAMNGATQELVEGNSQRTIDAAAQWKKEAVRIPE